MIPDWLEDMYCLVAKGDIDNALDVLFDKVDDLLLAGSFEECNRLLPLIDVGRLDTHLLVSVLSITKAASGLLPARQQLVRRVEERLAVIAPERVERLLGGLR